MDNAPGLKIWEKDWPGRRLERRGAVLWVWLDRPSKRNAFDEAMMRGLIEIFSTPDDQVRAMVLTGEGAVFCAGADLGWMSAHPDREGSKLVAGLFEAVRHSPRPVVARVNGPAIGGGVGLTACCDVAVARDDLFFQLAEVRVGIVPAVISPYVNEKIGPGRLREWILTAERISAAKAESWGLVSRLVPASGGWQALDAEVEQVLELLLSGALFAQKVGKEMVTLYSGLSDQALLDRLVDIITELRASNEAQARMKAFLGKSARRSSDGSSGKEGQS